MLSFGFRWCILYISFRFAFLISLWCRKHTSIWSIYRKYFFYPFLERKSSILKQRTMITKAKKRKLVSVFVSFIARVRNFIWSKSSDLQLQLAKGKTLKLSASLTSRNPFNIMFITNDWSFIRFPFFPSFLFLFSNNNQSTLHIIFSGIRTNKPIN